MSELVLVLVMDGCSPADHEMQGAGVMVVVTVTTGTCVLVCQLEEMVDACSVSKQRHRSDESIQIGRHNVVPISVAAGEDLGYVSEHDVAVHVTLMKAPELEAKANTLSVILTPELAARVQPLLEYQAIRNLEVVPLVTVVERDRNVDTKSALNQTLHIRWEGLHVVHVFGANGLHHLGLVLERAEVHHQACHVRSIAAA